MTQIARRANIISISNASQCEIETEDPHLFVSFEFVRLTNLNGSMPIPHGEDQLNNNRYRIIVTSDTTFKIQEPVTYIYVDSSNFTPYLEGGYCTVIEQDFYYYPNGPEYAEENNGTGDNIIVNTP